ncbi:hypothetical protein LTR41_000965 [Exophiala xenobiotica]|nr:hypothetical protein LTR41_000965 [Exophiala xenobiotica]
MSSSKVPIRSLSPTGSVRSTAPAGIGTSAYGDKKDGLKVEYFYGDRAKLGYVYPKAGRLQHSPESGLDYLTYSSGQWEEETREIFSKYDNFVERVTQIFGTPGEEHQAAQRIHNLRQTGSAAQYFALF